MKSPVYDTPRPLQRKRSPPPRSENTVQTPPTPTPGGFAYRLVSVNPKLRPPALPCLLCLWRRQCGRRPGQNWNHRRTNGQQRTRTDLPSPVAVSGTLPCIENTDKTPRLSLRCGTDLGKFRRTGCHSTDVTPVPGYFSSGEEGRRQRGRAPRQAGRGGRACR